MNGAATSGRVFPRDFALARLIGFQIISQADGKAVAEFQAGPQHANPMGTLHGGVLCDIADSAMGFAFGSTLQPDESFTTLELKINFHRPVWEAVLRAEAEVVTRGRTVGMAACKVTDEKGRLVASATSTCLVLSGDAAKNR
ncbi:MAG TPA: PaaI family thioesterase [Bryobacteraceae bacterium]|nr:PaaI family thioesterase [Bryobacteraceae bacterium]